MNKEKQETKSELMSLRKDLDELRVHSVLDKKETTHNNIPYTLVKPRLFSVTPIPIDFDLNTCCTEDVPILPNVSKVPTLKDDKSVVKANNFYNELSEFLKRDQDRIKKLLMS